ncbi:interleukin-12 receptor subunit beta-1 isoform X2 [Lissotriton helveticus]
MCRRAAGMTRWLMLLIVVIFPTDDDFLDEYMENCQEIDELNLRSTENWNRTTELETSGPTNLSCYLTRDSSTAVCTWEDVASQIGTTYRLYYTENDDTSNQQMFSAGSSMQCTIDKDYVIVKAFITVRVESCMSGCCYSSDNIALRLNDSVKYEAPAILNFSKLNGTLTMTWKRQKHVFLKRARYREEGSIRWTEIDCMSQDINEWKESEFCQIQFQKNFPFEIQVCHKRADVKNLWSEWSSSVKVPAEIVDGPELNYTVGNLSRSGHRKLDLNWKEAKREEGDVKYNIYIKMVACPCEESVPPISGTSLSVNISETSYNVSIFATNSAGSSPTNFYIIESHPEAGLDFRDISLSGTDSVQVWWAPTKRSSSYCVEWHPVSEQNIQSLCRIEAFEIKNFTYKGRVDPMTCYRIAVYRYRVAPRTWNIREEDKIWKTLGSTYYYKPSNKDLPRNVSVLDIREHSAVVTWDPFLTGECHGVLQKYNITIYPSHSKDSSKDEVAIISKTVHNFANLSAGIEYTVAIKGETEFGEETGIARIAFRTLKTDETAALWKLPVICVGILLGVFSTGGLSFVAVKRFKKIVCPEVPTPMDSVALTFSQDEMRQVCVHKALLYRTRSSAEGAVMEPVFVVPNIDSEVSFGVGHLVDSGGSSTAASKEAKMGKWENLARSSPESEGLTEPEDLVSAYKKQQVVRGSRPISICETDLDADNLPFSYQRQMVLASGEQFQENDEELLDLCSTRVEENIDKPTILHLLNIKGLFIAGSDTYKPEEKLNEKEKLSEFGEI